MKRPYAARIWLPLVAAVVAWALVSGFAGQSQAQQSDLPVSVSWELFANPQAQEGDPSVVLVVWVAPEGGFYAYGHEPGPTGQPTDLSVTPPPGVTAQILYPRGKLKPDVFDPSVEVEVYDKKTPLFVGLYGELPDELLLVGQLRMLLCSDTSCWPVQEDLVVEAPELTPGALSPAPQQAWWPRFQTLLAGAGPLEQPEEPAVSAAEDAAAPESLAAAEDVAVLDDEAAAAVAIEELDIQPSYFQPALEVHGVGKAALFAILAGFILNFMPCVLPVVSLKLSTLVAATGVGESGAKTRTFREHNIFFALGILIYFVVLGVVLGAAGLAWGQLFQKPGLVMGVTAVVFGLGLSLFGVFDLPVVDLKTGVAAKSHRTQALFTGLLATLLATPCSGPFLGGVLGWTLTQAPSTIVAVFLCIGLGMALPYVLMALRPGLVRLFPKPGNWTVFLERLVGFFLMGTCIYLLHILPADYMLAAMVLLLATAFGAWIWGAWTGLADPLGKRLAIRGLALLVVVATAFWAFQPPEPETEWIVFDGQTFQQDLGQQNMLVDFTADWCPNCKVLEKTTLAPDNLKEWKEQYDLKLLQADLTEDHPAAQALLQKLGSQSIPIVALFPEGEASSAPLVLRDVFTPSQLEKALQRAFAAGETD